MSTIADLRARIAKGEVKIGGSKGPKVGEGTFACLVESAQAGKGESGNFRGQVTVKVLSGGTDAEIGGKFNLYMQTVNHSYAEETIALWTEVLKLYGVNEDKVFDDANDLEDIVTNICGLLTKKAKSGGLKLVIKRKEQTNKDAQGRARYWNDVLLEDTKEMLADLGVQTQTQTPAKEAAQTPAKEVAKEKKLFDDNGELVKEEVEDLANKFIDNPPEVKPEPAPAKPAAKKKPWA